jgi:serine/threonine protein kinase
MIQSARYLAPEIIQSKGHSKGVDWWSLGILIFEMLAGYPPFLDDNPFGIYQKVLGGKVAFPRHLDSRAKDLIKKLLVPDKNKRLGCLRAGTEDVKKHKWFYEIDWAVAAHAGLAPPFIPSVEPWETTMFDKYSESTESSAQNPRDAEQVLFDGF